MNLIMVAIVAFKVVLVVPFPTGDLRSCQLHAKMAGQHCALNEECRGKVTYHCEQVDLIPRPGTPQMDS